MKQTEDHHIAEREVRDQQQGPIGRPRAPRRERVDAERRRASDQDLETMAGKFGGWGHAARARKNETIKKPSQLREFVRGSVK